MDLITSDPTSIPSSAPPPPSPSSASPAALPPPSSGIGKPVTTDQKSKRGTLSQIQSDTISAAKAALNPVRTNILPQKQKQKKKRFALAAAELNGAIYAVGGFDRKDYLKSAERFDPREHSWTRIEGMNTKRGCHSVTVMNEKLYVLGGFDGSAMVPSIEIVLYGGDCKTMMFVQISPSAADSGETICSLNFASRVRGVEPCFLLEMEEQLNFFIHRRDSRLLLFNIQNKLY